MKRLSALVLVLFLCTPAQAGPISWLKRHKRLAFEAGALVGASILEAKASTYCRRGDQERCFGGYGGPNAPLAVNTSVGTGLFFAAQKCHAEQGNWWMCYGLARYRPEDSASSLKVRR